MIKLKLYIIPLLLVTLQSCGTKKIHEQTKTETKLILGADRLINENIDLIKNKRIGLVVNKASVLSSGVPLLDTLKRIDGINVKAVFSPEHGYYINTSAGESITDTTENNIPFYSLYGKTKKPSPEMLKNIDMIIFDLQDVGTRYFTYISTLYYVLQAAKDLTIQVLVLDRPNPVGGYNVEGPVLKSDQRSFIGIAAVPVIYGMTIGELAQFFAGEYITGLLSASLKIIKMKNWIRKSFLIDYQLDWISPSPNIPDVKTALIYPATAFLEGTNISEGRGTQRPFTQIGAPFIDSYNLIKELDSLPHPGIELKPVSFTPVKNPGKSDNPKYENQKCNGISIVVSNPYELKPVDFSIQLLYVLHKLYPEKLKFNVDYFDRLTGDRSVREMLISDRKPGEIIASWQPELNKFLIIRNKYLLYQRKEE